MAVGTVEKVTSPPFSHAGNLGKLVRCSGREKEPPCMDCLAALESDRECGFDRDDLIRDELDAVAARLLTRELEQLGRRHPVAREETVHVRCRRVSRRAAIDDYDATPRAAENERGTEPGSAAPDDRNVVLRSVHGIGTVPVFSESCAQADTPAPLASFTWRKRAPSWPGSSASMRSTERARIPRSCSASCGSSCGRRKHGRAASATSVRSPRHSGSPSMR